MLVPEGFRVAVKSGAQVEADDQLARPLKRGKKASDLPSPVVAEVSGRVIVGEGKVTVTWLEKDDRVYLAPQTAYVVVKTGDHVFAGQELTAGLKNPHDILRIQGKESLQAYIIEEIQKVYRSQGVTINDKHVETIVRQMLRKVRIDHSGDSELLPGEPVDRFAFEETNKKILDEGGDPARGTPLLLGITRASLSTESFLAAASFQETTRVLTEAAVNGMVDRLEGLKENVIIGRLIPARLDQSEEGREKLGLHELEEEAGLLSVATEGRRYADDEAVEFSGLLDRNQSQRAPFAAMDVPADESPSLEAALEAVLESEGSSKADDDQPDEED